MNKDKYAPNANKNPSDQSDRNLDDKKRYLKTNQPSSYDGDDDGFCEDQSVNSGKYNSNKQDRYPQEEDENGYRKNPNKNPQLDPIDENMGNRSDEKVNKHKEENEKEKGRA